MTPFASFTSAVVLLPLDDIDTDQIIPARFLKGTDKAGLGDHLFADRRANPEFSGLPRRAPGGSPGPQILLAGAAGAAFDFAIDPFAKHCLVHGVDELGYLLSFEDRITAYERRQP